MTNTPEQAKTAEELGAALPPRTRNFVELYLQNGMNAWAASTAAKYSDPREGYRILRRPNVQEYLQARLTEEGFTPAEIMRRLQYQAGGSMADFLKVAETERSYWMAAEEDTRVQKFARERGISAEEVEDYQLTELFGPEGVAHTESGGRMVLVKEVAAQIDIDWRGAEQAQALGRVKKVKVDKYGVVEFELHDPVRALELLGKAHKLFTDKTEHSGSLDLGVKYIAGLSEDDL